MHAIRRMVVALCFGLAVAAGATAPPALADDAAPRAVVERLNGALVEVMRDADALGHAGRAQRLDRALRATFDFPQMARISVGRHWSTLSETERRALVDSFARMSIATFASRFDGYGGEHFEVIDSQPGPRGSVLVRNRLVKADGEAIEINYLLHDADGAWRVTDVYLDGVYSELATKRAEYSSVVAREGFDALIARIDAKVAELADGG